MGVSSKSRLVLRHLTDTDSPSKTINGILRGTPAVTVPGVSGSAAKLCLLELEEEGLVTLPSFGLNGIPLTSSGLTSKGACFFEDEAAEEERRSTEIRKEHVHDYKVACFSFLGGALAGSLTTVVLHFAFGL